MVATCNDHLGSFLMYTCAQELRPIRQHAPPVACVGSTGYIIPTTLHSNLILLWDIF